MTVAEKFAARDYVQALATLLRDPCARLRRLSWPCEQELQAITLCDDFLVGLDRQMHVIDCCLERRDLLATDWILC